MTSSIIASSQLASIKNALRDLFPDIKSSHLSEAIAFGIGFNTHAAQRAAIAEISQTSSTGPLFTMDSTLFEDRLRKFGYDLERPFSFDQLPLFSQSSSVPLNYRTLVQKIAMLEGEMQPNFKLIGPLRSECKAMIAEQFGLGSVAVWDQIPNRVSLWTVGITHTQTRKKGWGDFVKSSNSYLTFPGEDHSVSFVHRLPLSDGRFVDYVHAVVSMPYQSSNHLEKIEHAKKFADNIGWTTEELPEWTWYQSRSTTLILHRRTTSKEVVEKLWNSSFKKWLIENKASVKKNMARFPRLIVDDIINCQHMPLDLVDFEDCYQRYLNEFVFQNSAYQDSEITKVFEKLFMKWRKAQLI